MTAERKAAALTDADLTRMQIEALAEIKDPEARIKAIADIRGGESVAIQRESLELQRLQHRASTNATSQGEEGARLADEHVAAVALVRRPWTAFVSTALTFDQVFGSPTLQIMAKVGGHQFGTGETRVVSRAADGSDIREDAAGKHAISTCTITPESIAEVSAILRADAWRGHEFERADYTRRGDTEGLALLTKQLEGRGSREGVPWRLWKECTQILLRRIVRQHGVIEDLLAANIVALVDPPGIVIDETPLRTRIEP